MRKASQGFLLLLTCFLLTAASHAPIDVTGTWTGTMSQKSDDGQAMRAAIVFHLNQEGDQVTGTAGPPDESPGQIREVKLEGNRLRFTVGGGAGPRWKFDLKVSGDSMWGHADGQSASGRPLGTADVSLSRQK
jgi:hypothetical protein